MSRPGADGNLTLRILGTTTVEVGGAPRPVGPRERTFLAAVAFGHPRAVDVDVVADALWTDERPRTYRQSVHNLVSTLRRALGADAIVTEAGPAYRLGAAWTVDIAAFTTAVDLARRARAADDQRAERVHLLRALEWCRGEAYADLPDDTSVVGRRAAHLQAVLTVEEDAVFAELDAGDPLAAVGLATGLVAAEPYREVRWSLLALAAYRADQRGAALSTLARARTVLREDLGLAPGPALVRLERSVLHDERRLVSGSSRAALGMLAPAAPAGAAVGVSDGDAADPAAPGALRSLLDGGGDDPSAAIDAMCAAADSAAEAGLFTDAAGLLASAVGVAERAFGRDDERTLRLLLRAAEQRRRAGDATYPDALWDVMDRADRSGAETIHALATAALCKLGPMTESGGGTDASLLAAVERALTRCPDPAARARCAGEVTLYFSMKGEADRCRSYFDEALSLARQVGDPDLMLSALGNAYLGLNLPSDLPQRADLAAEMLALAEREGGADTILEALHFVFAVQVQQADPMLRTTLAREIAMATSVGSAARRWMAGYQHTCVRYLEGRLDEAEALALRTLEIAPVAPSRSQGTYLMSLLNIREAQGREQELAEAIDAAVAQHPGMPAWRTIVAWLAARRGDADRVRIECDAVDAGRALPPDLAWSGATMLLGRAVALIGDVERSRRVYDLIAPYAGQFTWISSTTTGPYDLALAELAVVLGEQEAATRHIAGLARGIARTGAEVYRPDLERLRSLVG